MSEGHGTVRQFDWRERRRTRLPVKLGSRAAFCRYHHDMSKVRGNRFGAMGDFLVCFSVLIQ